MRIPRFHRGRRVSALAVLVLFALPALASAQCAMCGTVGQGKKDPLVKGMFASILFMVTMPFAVVGTLGRWIWTQHRRDQPPPPHDEQNGDRS